MSFTAKPQDSFTVVSVNDEALDKTSLQGVLAIKRYIRERDASVLVRVPGARAAEFRCRPLSNSARTACEAIDAEVLRNQLAFAACLEGIDNLGIEWAPRFAAAGWSPTAKMLDGESLDRLADLVGGKVIEEIGAVCLQRANLTAQQGKAYRLPLGYVVLWPSANVQNTPTTAAHDSMSGSDAAGQ